MKALALLLVLVGCGDDTSVPDCAPVSEARLCPSYAEALCLDSTSAPVTECLVWHRPIASQPLVAALCVAACN